MPFFIMAAMVFVKKWILAPTRRRRRAVCVMCCGNVFFCALCAGGALVRGEIGRQPHFLWSAPDDRARGRLFNGNVRSMAVYFISRGAEIAPNFVKIILCCWGYVTYSSRLFIA